MNLIKTKEGIGTEPASYIVELENQNKNEAVSDIFLQFEKSKGNPCTINVEISVNISKLRPEEGYEKKEFTIKSKADLERLLNAQPSFNLINRCFITNAVVMTLISAYMPSNWFLSLR